MFIVCLFCFAQLSLGSPSAKDAKVQFVLDGFYEVPRKRLFAPKGPS